MIKINKDKETAESLKDHALSQFSSQSEFSEFIKDLAYQKKNGLKLKCDLRYFYLTKYQSSEFNSYQDSIWNVRMKNLRDSLIEQMHSIFNVSDPITIVDLGVGPAIKPISLYPEIHKAFNLQEYIGVDFSANVLNSAKRHIEKYDFPFKSRFLKLNFHDIATTPTELLDEIHTKQRIFLLLGGTHGGFAKQEMQALIKKIVRPGDLLVLDFHSLGTDDTKLQTMKNAVKNHMDTIYERKITPLLEIGFSKNDLEFKYKYDKINKLFVASAKVLSVPVAMNSVISKSCLEVDDVVQLFIARKPTLDEIRNELEEIGLNVDIVVSQKEEELDIAFCRLR